MIDDVWCAPQFVHWARNRVDELARDVGHLRRALEPDTIAAYRAERVAGHVQTLATALEPTAAEIVAVTFPGDEHTALAAIDHVDKRDWRLRHLLGERAA